MRKPPEPDKSEIRKLILEIEMCLEALKRKLCLVSDPVVETRVVASSKAFGRKSCTNRPLRSTPAAAATRVVHPELGTL